jgi:hypothetical protein
MLSVFLFPVLFEKKGRQRQSVRKSNNLPGMCKKISDNPYDLKKIKP